MKRSFFIVLIVALFAAACGTPPPNSLQWCFRFKFAYDDYGFGMAHGAWVAGVGFESDELGDLAITYLHRVTVYPQQVILHVVRTDTSSPSNIDVLATADIFGLASGTLSNTLPNILNEIDLPYTAEVSGMAGTAINISAHQNHADEPLALQYVEIRGTDVNPFGTNNCDGSTPTPSPMPASATPVTPSPTPTGTLPSPTPTNTPTITPTPSNTPTPGDPPFTCVWSGGGLTDWDFGYIEGSGGANGTWSTFGLLTSAGSNTSHYTHIEFDYTWDGFGGGAGSALAIWSWGSGTLRLILVAPLEAGTGHVEVDYAGDDYQILLGGNTSDGEVGTITITRIEIDGTGANYFCDNSTDTPTPTPSLTPSRTSTINPSWTATRTPRPLGTALTGTPSRTPSRTPIPLSSLLPPTATYVLGTLPPPATSYATVTPAASYTPNATLTYEYIGTITATYGGTGTPGATGTPYSLPWPTSFPGDGGGAGGSNGVGGVVGYGNGVIGFVSNAFQQGLGWLGEFRTSAVAMITTYQNAAPQALPGLPHCATDRLSSELCAIYYILTYTVLSGTVGSLIIPVAVIDIDIFIIFTFIRLARAILARLTGILRQ